MDALLDGLEESADGEGGIEVVLESLRGLSVLLAVQYQKSISPRVVLALKPFVEKQNWEMKLAAISALGAIGNNWKRLIIVPNEDLVNHLLGCLPSLIIRLEDSNITIVKVYYIIIIYHIFIKRFNYIFVYLIIICLCLYNIDCTGNIT
jgi:hypothetical protein